MSQTEPDPIEAPAFDEAETDAAGVDASAFEAPGMDAQGMDAQGMDVQEMDTQGMDGTGSEGSGMDALEEDQLNQAIEELRGVLNDDPEHASAFPAGGSSFANSSIIMGIPVEVQIVLGSTEMPVSDLMALQKGSTVALNRRIGEPVDLVVNGRQIARGEITVLENDPSRFGVKLTEIAAAKPGN